MIDSEHIIKGLETVINNLRKMDHVLLADFCEDALDLLKEQEQLIEIQHNSLRLDADLISILNKKIQEIGEKPVLDEYGRCFLNALKRQLDMKLQFIEILTTPDFADKIVELFETVFDC